ncbi:hypothetical protein BDQ17DRAFT_1217761, partial [Cyathus striatus]
IYLEELQEELHTARDVSVSKTAIIHALKSRGFTRKKVSAPALKRNEECRAEFQIHIAENYWPEQLVFVDEAGVNRTTMKRERAWVPVGWRAWHR